MVNYSTESIRRVDFTFGIGYNDDIDKVKVALLDIAKSNDKVLNTPEIFIAVSELADSSVNFALRVWVKSSDYWDVSFDFPEKVKKRFDKDGISIPFPQRDIHVYNESNPMI